MNRLLRPAKPRAYLRYLKAGVYTVGNELEAAVKNICLSPQTAFSKIDYNAYWTMRGFHSLQPRYQIFERLIEPETTVLDIGCGEGLLLQYLSQSKQVTGYGIDISATALKMARSRGVQTIAADIRNWEIQGIYDYIIMSEVIEHLTDSEIAIQNSIGHFRKALLVSIPNIGYYPHRLRLLFGRFPIQWGWHPAEHLRYWTVIDFKEWVSQFELKVTGVYSSNGFPVLHQWWPNLWGNQIVFVIESHTAAYSS